MHTAQPPGAICSLSGAGSQHSAAASGDGAVSPHTSHAVQLLISSPNARRVDHRTCHPRLCSTRRRRLGMRAACGTQRIRTSPCLPLESDAGFHAVCCRVGGVLNLCPGDLRDVIVGAVRTNMLSAPCQNVLAAGSHPCTTRAPFTHATCPSLAVLVPRCGGLCPQRSSSR